MRPDQQDAKRILIHLIAGSIVASAILCIWIASLFYMSPYILPGVKVDNIDVGGKTQEEVKNILQSLPITQTQVSFEYEDHTVATSSASLGLYRDFQPAIQKAWSIGRKSNPLENVLTLFGLYKEMSISSSYRFNKDLTTTWIKEFALQHDVVGVQPSVSLKTSGKISTLAIQAGKEGKRVDQEELLHRLSFSFDNIPSKIVIPLIITPPLTPDENIVAQRRASSYIGKTLTVVIDGQTFSLNDQKMMNLLELPTGYKQDAIEKLLSSWQKIIRREPQEPNLRIENGKVKEFQEPLYGRDIDLETAKNILIENLQKIEHANNNTELPKEPISIPVTKVEPKTPLARTNNIGIIEKIGEAETLFAHSIPNRVHNVELTAKRMNLALIQPEETFSFNKALGNVSKETGYLPAYVISGGRTVLGDGGGVCQVSTTLFRATLAAGLPIVERHGHSYRVGYYEQNSPPGIDATVFESSADFRFKNNTPSPILITTSTDTKNLRLRISFWGTSDGRVSEIIEHTLWDVTGPRPTVYQDDPTLPPGALRQVDWSAPGTKTSFRYRVTRNTEVLENRVFKTVYEPWAAVYLRGI